MKVLNIGSMNIDNVYSVDHIVKPGETLSVSRIEVFAGGKGLNQSIAMAKAGLDVWHFGIVGSDGAMLIELMEKNGVHTELIKSVDADTGHTIIQVDKNGQNAILLYGGTNDMLNEEYIDKALEMFGEGDMLVLQNEVNMLPYIIDTAYKKGIAIALNPSPFNERITKCDLSKVDIFILNEIEAEMMTGEKLPDMQLVGLLKKYPAAKHVLTLGSKGCFYKDSRSEYFQDIYKTDVVDTTGAGDTFLGFFLSAWVKGMKIQDSLSAAAKAASIAVSRKGAAAAVPTWNEVMM